ncbi:MAG: amidohydrolase [Micromonosporaceae bacterium]
MNVTGVDRPSPAGGVPARDRVRAAPRQPYPGRAARLLGDIRRAAAGAAPLTSPYHGYGPDLVGQLARRVEALGSELVGLSHDLHAHPETAFAERHAAAAVATALARHGVDVQVGAYGLQTAFRARVGAGAGSSVAVIAEYDALPGLGHACGHNVICAVAVGAFIALAPHLGQLGGTVELIGAPAEESGGGKQLILDAGGFSGVDAAAMVHPGGFDVAAHPTLGRREVHVVYHGISAHAALAPHLGRNALDAAVDAYTGLARLRQHMLPTDRLHAVITDGGRVPNVVPDRAALVSQVRSFETDSLAELCDRVDDVLRAAALATGTIAEVRWDGEPPYLPLRHNLALAARYAVHQVACGRTVLPPGVVPAELTGSTDLGNVSQVLPVIQPLLAIAPPETNVHTAAFARSARTPEADRGVLDGAYGLAATLADYLADEALRTAVNAEFAEDRSADPTTDAAPPAATGGGGYREEIR